MLFKEKQNPYGGVSLSESCGDSSQQCGVAGLRRHGESMAERALDLFLCVALNGNAR